MIRPISFWRRWSAQETRVSTLIKVIGGRILVDAGRDRLAHATILGWLIAGWQPVAFRDLTDVAGYKSHGRRPTERDNTIPRQRCPNAAIPLPIATFRPEMLEFSGSLSLPEPLLQRSEITRVSAIGSGRYRL